MIMKKRIIKIIAITAIAVTMLISSITANTATIDEAVISPQSEELAPYTTPIENSFEEYKTYEMTARDYRVFYTQTTFLALLAGYLILVKTKIKKNKDSK